MTDLVTVRSIPPVPLDSFEPSRFRWGWHPRVETAVRQNHTLVISDHGIGKTYTGMIVAKTFGAPLWYISASYGLERATYEGTHYPVQTETGISLQAIDGYVTSAARASAEDPERGALLIIDEFFRQPGDVQSVLFAAMDAHRGIMTIAYRGETIRVGSKFRVLGFTNPPSPLYPEVEVADRALLSRFAYVLRLPFPDGNEIAKFMAHINFPEPLVVTTIHFTLKVRDAYNKGELDNFISPRDLVFFNESLKLGGSPEDSLKDTIVGKFGAQHEEAILAFWRAHSV